LRNNTATKVRHGRSSNRRSPLATVALLTIGLMATGGAYALFTSTASAETSSASQATVQEGQKLFAANCATCHGISAQGTKEGPSLYGVGAASVDFQVGTGRMPLAMQGPQAEQKPPQFTQDQIDALAAYVASLAPGPAVPDEQYLQGNGNVAAGAELFRVNCAMCHNAAGAGGALTRGKYAPAIGDITSKHVYEAMLTGPQSMPVFNDANLTPESKRDVIAFLTTIDEQENPGGMALGSLGPVTEGLFAWVFGLGILVGCAVWLGSKSA
jgi:ubiquinol-cytochrome c reductase cytochrome c subunit